MVHCRALPNSAFGHWAGSLTLAMTGAIYIAEIGKCYKLALSLSLSLSFLESWLLNIY